MRGHRAVQDELITWWDGQVVVTCKRAAQDRGR